jgi:FMN phosphatase YigB (HAD superfamily)
MTSKFSYIWDLDGTLYYKNPVYSNYKRYLLKTFLAQDLNVSLETIEQVWNSFQTQLSDSFGRKPSPREIFCQFPYMTEDTLTEIRRGINPKGYIRTNPNLIQLLSSRKNSLAIVLFSTFPRDLVNKSLRVLGVPQNLFKAVIAREDVTNTKPNFEGFVKAAHLLECPKRDYGLITMCGDKYPHDIEPALALGMRGLLVRNGPDDLLQYLRQYL